MAKERFEKIDNTRYIDIDVENEMKDSFIAYAMAVNVSRARRIIFLISDFVSILPPI